MIKPEYLKGNEMMKQKDIWMKILIYGLGIFLVLGFLYYWIGSKNLRILPYTEEYASVTPTQVTPTLTENTIVTQTFTTHADVIEGIVLRFATYNNTLVDGDVDVSLISDQNEVLYNVHIPVTILSDNEDFTIVFDELIDVLPNSQLKLEIKEYNNTDGNAASVWMGEKQADCVLYVNGVETENTLYFNLISYKNGHFIRNFGITALGFCAFFVMLCFYQRRKMKAGVKTGLNECVYIFKEYSFLLKQLIGRDFAVKYRRSYLGIVWVILNPLLTMIILSSVFSFIFRFTIENFPVYLILGQIIFNFYSEATQISITTITSSGQMIKKIYVPKYIFPLSKTMFSFFNFVLSFIPVILVMIYYKIPITINIVYLPTLLVFFFCFVLGVCFILSALQVFLRDTQYLYGIFLTLLGYTTPIFYSIETMSPLIQKVMLINPLYHYMNTLRTILLYGETPTVQQMAACMIIGIIFLAVGMGYFFRKQKKFILYI